MAKDDYFVIVYKVLVYLYACFKRKIMFDENTFRNTVRKNVESDDYFCDILQMMQENGLIRGVCFTKAWGECLLLASDLRDMKITQAGIEYLQDNSKMQKVGEFLKTTVDAIAQLAALVQ